MMLMNERILHHPKILTFLIVLLLQFHSSAQASFHGQAKSAEEFDSYLSVLHETAPEKVIEAAQDFEQHWPESELAAEVFELRSEAHRALGDANSAIRYGKRALVAAPDNLTVLTNLAYVIADSSTDPSHLGEAEKYARRELELAQTIHIPRKVSPQEWHDTRRHLDSVAHASLGLIAYKRENLRGAIQEFETAVQLGDASDPALCYRLGLLYRAAGDRAKAIEMLQRAAAMEDSTIRSMAERELHSLSPNR
jgi:tetratricopeptide (TPR) repeat protein